MICHHHESWSWITAKPLICFLLLCSVAIETAAVEEISYIWTNQSGDSLWSNPENWSSSSSPAPSAPSSDNSAWDIITIDPCLLDLEPGAANARVIIDTPVEVTSGVLSIGSDEDDCSDAQPSVSPVTVELLPLSTSSSSSSSSSSSDSSMVVVVGISGTMVASNTLIHTELHGRPAGSNILGDLFFTNVVYDARRSMECRGHFFHFAGGSIIPGKTLAIKGDTSSGRSSRVQFDSGGRHKFDFINIGEYARVNTNPAVLSIQDSPTHVEATKFVNIGNSKNDYGMLELGHGGMLSVKRSITFHSNGSLRCHHDGSDGPVIVGVISFEPQGAEDEFSIRSGMLPTNFEGVRCLRLIAKPSTETGRANIEAAGPNVGRIFPSDDSMFTSPDKFALSELHVAGSVRLIDRRDNQQVEGRPDEALYVQSLFIVGDTILDLNGLNLYCGQVSNPDGHAFNIIGNQMGSSFLIVPTPDPERSLTIGTWSIERPTWNSLGFQLSIEGDLNRDASVSVQYQRCADSSETCNTFPPEDWQDALPMLRLQGEMNSSGSSSGQWIAPNMFAGSVLNLDSGFNYRVRFIVNDPDGMVLPHDGSFQMRGSYEYMIDTTEDGSPLRTRMEREHTTIAGAGIVHTVEYVEGDAEQSWTNLVTTYQNANPGDIIHVPGPGIYQAVDGQALVLGYNEDGTTKKETNAANPITLRGVGGPVLHGSGGEAVLDFRHASHHIVEGFHVTGGRTLAYLGQGLTEGARHITLRWNFFDNQADTVSINNQYWGIYCRSVCYDVDITNNVFTGVRTNWARAILPNEAHPAGTAVIIGGQGHVIAHNRISGFRDGIALYRLIPIPDVLTNSIDIFENDVSGCDDDAVQLDFGFHNIRLYRNYIHRSMIGISMQPTYGGPHYVYRNVLFNMGIRPFKDNGWPSGMLVYHNTIQTSKSPTAMSGFWQNGQFINNRFCGNERKLKVLATGTPFPERAIMRNNVYCMDPGAGHKIIFFLYQRPDGTRNKTLLRSQTFNTLAEFEGEFGLGQGSMEQGSDGDLESVPVIYGSDGYDYWNKCRSGLTFDGNLCRQTCSVDSDCPSSDNDMGFCDDEVGACQVGCTLDEECTNETTLSFPQTCQSGICTPVFDSSDSSTIQSCVASVECQHQPDRKVCVNRKTCEQWEDDDKFDNPAGLNGSLLDLRPKVGSVGVDVAELLPTINDQYTGSKPDVGAFEWDG